MHMVLVQHHEETQYYIWKYEQHSRPIVQTAGVVYREHTPETYRNDSVRPCALEHRVPENRGVQTASVQEAAVKII